MEAIKALFVKPDPNAQHRKCNTLIRSNIRKLDRDLGSIKQVETKTKNLVLQADRRAQRDPARAEQARREARTFAGELLRARKTQARLVTSKAQLSSVQLQVNEAFAVRKIEGSIRASVGIMRDVNRLIRLPELAGTMRELTMELMKAGVVEEMIDETLPEDEPAYGEDEAAETEIDRVLAEILRDKVDKTPLPAAPAAPAVPAEPAPPVRRPIPAAVGGAPVPEDTAEEEDTEAMMNEMRSRLDALRS